MINARCPSSGRSPPPCSTKIGPNWWNDPLASHVPIPETIANGDLYGDLYFATWYQPFLKQAFKGDGCNDRLAENVDQDVDDDDEPPYTPAWLSEAQAFLCNTEYRKDYGRIIGALHSQWAMLFVFPFPTFNDDDDDTKIVRAATVNITALQLVVRTRHTRPP
jgi:hypothetical protein